MLEPFVDTVVVCTMTALVVIITGTWQVNTKVGDAGATLLAEAKEGSAQVQALDAGQFLRKVKDQKVGESDWLNVRVLKEEGAEYYETGVEGWIPADQATAFTGIPVTSLAFEGVIGFFPAILSIAVILFAFSTMISWSYYGEQGVLFIFKGLEPAGQKTAVLIYKIAFCGIVVVGAAASLGSVLVLSDAMIFAMVFPNLIGVYWLLNEVKREQKDFLQHVKEVESGDNAA
ncbi:MAG: alanine:cation symporter family protein [Verrucomicrobiales bacterium]